MRSLPEPRLGEVWSVIFDPVRGHEQGGIRPALVLSNDAFNSLPHTLCIVVPITRTNKGIPFHIPVFPPEGGMVAPSFILCEQERSASITRFRRRMGSVDESTLRRVQELVGKFIDR
ncbi:MAG: type II toxin-antitoxin system PemK/MazF family toxin [Thermomicrobiales bacterium]